MTTLERRGPMSMRQYVATLKVPVLRGRIGGYWDFPNTAMWAHATPLRSCVRCRRLWLFVRWHDSDGYLVHDMEVSETWLLDRSATRGAPGKRHWAIHPSSPWQPENAT